MNMLTVQRQNIYKKSTFLFLPSVMYDVHIFKLIFGCNIIFSTYQYRCKVWLIILSPPRSAERLLEKHDTAAVNITRCCFCTHALKITFGVKEISKEMSLLPSSRQCADTLAIAFHWTQVNLGSIVWVWMLDAVDCTWLKWLLRWKTQLFFSPAAPQWKRIMAAPKLKEIWLLFLTHL